MQFLVVTNLGQALKWSLWSRPRSAKSQDSCSFGLDRALPRAKIMQFLVVTNLGQAQWLCQEQIHAVSCSYKPGTSPVALPRAKMHAVSCNYKLGTSPALRGYGHQVLCMRSSNEEDIVQRVYMQHLNRCIYYISFTFYWIWWILSWKAPLALL